MKNWRLFKKPSLVSKKKKTKDKWLTQYEPIFFDSETSKKTHIETFTHIDGTVEKTEVVDDCWVYVWACSVGTELYYGRYIHEFFDFLKVIMAAYDINEENRIDIQVHNLSYDISYMWDLLLNFDPEAVYESLFTAPRKIISHQMGNGITFKCTYKLSGRSLDKWCKDLQVEHRKQSGMIDYQLTYKPEDPLPHEQYKYLAYDILSLKDCYYKEIALQGYNFVNAPLTKTGFVRKMFQKEFMAPKKYWKNSELFHQCEVNEQQYNRLLKASAGGMTASSIRYISTEVFHPFGIGHIDFESHYPTQQIINLFPMRPRTIKEPGDEKRVTLQMLKWYEEKFHNYYIVDIELKDPTLKKGVTAPFLFTSKVIHDADADVISCNGKIVKVSGVVRATMTNFDLKIIMDQYDITGYYIQAVDVYSTRRLPDYVLDVINRLYKDKSETKAQLKEDEDNIDLQVTYQTVKGNLNSVFGCTYTRPVRENVTIDRNFDYHIEYNSNTLEEFYERKSSCLAYQWGVFTTAQARFELWQVIKNVVGYENFLYCDTDSCFYLDSPQIRWRLNQYNAACEKDSLENGYYIEVNGKKKLYHHLDYEDDSGKANIFKALHAKCYGLQFPTGKIKITVAGVSRRAPDGTTREDELGSLKNLSRGFTFVKCGGTRADYSTIRDYDGRSGGGCAILNTTKTIHDCLFSEEDITYHDIS